MPVIPAQAIRVLLLAVSPLLLVPHGEIVIVSGNAPAVLPKYRWPSGL
jgi:hypothetical protein